MALFEGEKAVTPLTVTTSENTVTTFWGLNHHDLKLEEMEHEIEIDGLNYKIRVLTEYVKNEIFKQVNKWEPELGYLPISPKKVKEVNPSQLLMKLMGEDEFELWLRDILKHLSFEEQDGIARKIVGKNLLSSWRNRKVTKWGPSLSKQEVAKRDENMRDPRKNGCKYPSPVFPKISKEDFLKRVGI